MDQKIIQSFKDKLEDRKSEIIKELEGIGKRADGAEINFNAQIPEYGDSAEDNAVEVADYAKNLSFERELEKSLAEVERALKRIETDKFGLCENCDQEIAIERLQIRPESAYCVECKNQMSGENK